MVVAVIYTYRFKRNTMAQRQNPVSQVLFAHSAGPQYAPGKGSYDLVKYLRSSLPDGYRVLFPIIEKPSSPTYHKYKQLFKDTFAKLDEPVILVGHSLGASTLLKYLSEERPAISIRGLFLVSTPQWRSNMKEFQLKENFQDSLEDIPAIFLYHSKADTEVPIEHLAFYEKAFPNAVVRRLKGKEHVFASGLSALVRDIQSL